MQTMVKTAMIIYSSKANLDVKIFVWHITHLLHPETGNMLKRNGHENFTCVCMCVCFSVCSFHLSLEHGCRGGGDGLEALQF